MADTILEVKHLKKYFNTPKGLLHAVDDVNFTLERGKTLGIVGESGCGKSTTGRSILRLIEPTSGEVIFDGEDVCKKNKNELRLLRRDMQLIFQDPYASLDPRKTVSEIIAEPLKLQKLITDPKARMDRVRELMQVVGLADRLINTYPHELDGGRRQRIGIARALAMKPKLIVCDEPVSALDVSIQAQILNLMQDLQEQKGYTQSQAYQLVYRGGLKIYSTQNTKLQKIADSVINNPDNYPVATKFSLEYKLQVTHADSSSSTYTEINVASYFRKNKKDPTYKTIYNSKKEMKAAVKAFRKSVMKKGDKKKAESIHYSMEPQLSYSLIDQKTGQVKVLVGGRGQKQDDLALNRATSVKRQPGSTFKILSTYAPAIDTGSMTLATVFDDAPYQYENGQKVTNYVSTSYKGLTTVRDAIIDSNNIVAVKALTDLTPQVGFDFLQKLGFTTLVNNRVSTNGTYESDVNQSLALGGITDGVTNVELTAAYAAIANQGTYNTPVLYTTVKDSNGNVLLSNKKKSRKVIKKSTAWLLTNAMEDVVKKGTGRAAQLDSDMAVAAKTGTTSNNYDYWFCGYTPYYTASVWTGYDYNTSFDNDEDYHKVIWKKIMDRIISEKKQKVKSFPSNKNIKKAEICIKSGKKALPNVCSKDPEKSMVRTEYFASGTVPKDSCDAHIAVTFCLKSHLVAQKFCPDKFRYTKIFRVRPKHSSHKTDDEPYFLNIDINNKCNIHTEEWHQKKLEKKKKKQEEKLKKQQKQQQSGNDTTDTSINNIEKQIKKLLN